ncbi:MAG: glycosyltransferase [Pelatocladus maniniholoensis HA4357-MV3]|jgi:GT2 family glycosyltransferase|uniref:Glycosyltransferase n=1 Tax=Pelatocladus maniniholoensis HA4357-MV3 TaxID=1117104 RepID=A0A9E3HCU8_9NOST|nr:glycosyltransferase [Pelatocladus maniniholoensis HA4357-MV3]
MNKALLLEPEVTIVVVPRERFSYSRESLESIYDNTDYPFKLIYVDGGSPTDIKNYLQAKAAEKQFKLIRTDHYLSPNHARNIGLRQVNSKYVVFMDNDVAVTPGWLQALVDCAEATEATIVSPLVCQYLPLHTEVHCAGGESGVKVETKGETTRRRMIEKIYKQGRKVSDVRPQLQRQPTGLAEFHCMLVRTEIFDRIGLLDEGLLNTKEHVDLCILVSEAGGTVYLEPESLITYVPGPPLKWTDLHFYMLRWSDAWELTSLKRLRDKWNLTEDEYFQNKYKRLGWRRDMTIVNPLVRKVPLGKFGSRALGKILREIDKALNHYLTSRYAKRYLQGLKNQVPPNQPPTSTTLSSQN